MTILFTENSFNFVNLFSEPEKDGAVPEKEPATEPESEPSTEPVTVQIPTMRPQPFRPRIYNKTKRLIHHAPLRERLTLQNASNLSKRNTRTKRAIPSEIIR